MVIQSLNGVYLHAAWATSANGDDFSLVEFADATYRGTYSDKSSTESTDPISYSWMLIGDIAGADNGTDELEAENTASIATAQAEEAISQTIVNNNNIQSSQDDTDMSTGNPNELAGTNQGTNNWSASAGLTISAVTDTIYNENDEAVNYLHVECDTAGANYIAFNASLLRAKLAELTEDNSFTLSADIRMSTVFDMPVAVEDTDGSNVQIDFGTIEPELIPVPEETADGLWVYAKSTADCENEVAESSQVLFFDLTNMGVGESLDIANLKVEGGGLATPWKASLDEVAQLANQAYQVAADTEQHFWFTSTGVDTGAHITEKTQADFIADPTNGGGNLLARSNGIALREGMIELATLQQSGLYIKSFDEFNQFVNLGVIGYGPGNNGSGGTADAPFFTFGRRVDTIGNYSVIQGNLNRASGFASHAEGQSTKANGNFSHAEGESATASGNCSHAEGQLTKATGNYSHAQNFGTEAGGTNQTALGRYNVVDNANTYVIIIGNGTADNARSNALTVDWSGNVETSGDITASGDVHVSGDIYLDTNRKYIYGVSTGGQTRNLLGYNNSNQLVIGYGPYSASEGETVLEGNDVRILSKGDTKASFSGGTAHCVGTMDSLVREAHSTPTATLAGNTQSGALSATFTKSGYYPLAIAGFQSVGSYGTHVVPSNLRITSASSGSCTISYTLKNTSSSSSTNTGLTVHVLWIKV